MLAKKDETLYGVREEDCKKEVEINPGRSRGKEPDWAGAGPPS